MLLLKLLGGRLPLTALKLSVDTVLGEEYALPQNHCHSSIRKIMASSPSKSNEERARWRALCRQKLAEHISEYYAISIEEARSLQVIDGKLDLEVKPEDVRLLTSSEDAYYWSALPNSQHLFHKQLSKHSLRAYQEIYKNVGLTFEAVSRSVPFTKLEHGQCEAVGSERADICDNMVAETFTHRIETMAQEIITLKTQYSEATERAAARKKESEDQARLIVQIRAQNEGFLADINKLQSTVQHQNQIIRQCKNRVAGSERALFIIRRTLDHAEKGRRHVQ